MDPVSDCEKGFEEAHETCASSSLRRLRMIIEGSQFLCGQGPYEKRKWNNVGLSSVLGNCGGSRIARMRICTFVGFRRISPQGKIAYQTSN